MSGPGEFLAGQRPRFFSSPETEIVAGVDCYQNRIEVNAGGPTGWTLIMSAPVGEVLRAGSYADAQRHPFNPRGTPGLDLSGEHNGCNRVTGAFQVFEARFRQDRSVERFHARFLLRCQGSDADLTGEVQLTSPGIRAVFC